MTRPITRQQYEQHVKPIIDPAAVRTGRPRMHDAYDIVCSILRRERDELSWRQLGTIGIYDVPWRTVIDYYNRWQKPQKSSPGGPIMPRIYEALKDIDWRAS